jgi:hypothetical protein
LLNVQTCHYKMCVWHHHDHFPFSQNHSCNSCALAIAFGSDKQSKCCRTHQVLVITMKKTKENNNKPILKVVTTKTLQPPKRYHSADVCLPAVTRPRHNLFEIKSACHRRGFVKGTTWTIYLFVPSRMLIDPDTHMQLPWSAAHPTHGCMLCYPVNVACQFADSELFLLNFNSIPQQTDLYKPRRDMLPL